LWRPEQGFRYNEFVTTFKGETMKRMRRVLHLVISLVLLLTTLNVLTVAAQDPPPYLDPDLPIEERVEDLLSRMSLTEKVGQMTLIEKNSLSPEDVTTYFIGGVLSGGGGYPQPNTPEAWAEMVADFQNAALATPLGIPMIYGVDAVHGHNNVRGAVIFPHNVGLGATRDADLVRQIGMVTAQEMIATNIYWNYAPVVAVPQDIRWGRTYEGYSENTDLVTLLGTAYLRGLQDDDLAAAETVLGTPKHYVGDGGAAWGTSPFGPNNIDRGVTEVDEATLRAIHLPPYQDAIEAGARSIMISFSSWGGLSMHAQQYLITDVLKDELGFTGFAVSDWAGIDAISNDYYEAVVVSINAGLDMIMVPQDTETFIDALTRAVESGDVPLERLDDAVRRILRVKFELGLFERPLSDGSLLAEVGSEAHRALARQAVQESLVLLKNEEATLPLSRDLGTLFIAGVAADDIGAQSGGWTIEWQGGNGNITPGTTIRDAIEATVSEDTAVYFDPLGRFRNATDADGNPLHADVGIVMIGEPPYAEWEGDSSTLALPTGSAQLIERVRERADRVVVILLSGRPLVITDALNPADAFVAAWLPGTEGEGVADVLFGDAPFSGQLPYTWPRTIDQIPFDFANLPTEGCDAPLFPYGYGLTADSPDSIWTDLAKSCADYTEASEAVVAEPPAAMPTPAPVGGPLAPEGEYGETYYAPFPVAITLDGDFSDWVGVPTVTLPDGADLTSGDPAVTFAAAADDTYLYLRGDVIDSHIISGEHGTDYWNEDSVEFYINATGDLGLTSYTDGVAQITLPALNAGLPPEEAVIAGVQGPSAEAEVVTVLTDTGWAVEVAVPPCGTSSRLRTPRSASRCTSTGLRVPGAIPS
jgi:beta-glucosidase